MRILHFEEIDSTNLYAKSKRSEGEDLVVVARRQTGGLGTKGRSFASDEGGVYLTRLTFYRDFPATDAFKIMINISVGVCKTLEKFGLSPKIKWPNDVYVQDRKICGISTENTCSGRTIANSVVGIGLNVNNELPTELKEIAISMKEAAGREFPLEEVEAALIEETGKLFDIEEYRARVGYMRREVTLILDGKRIPAYTVSVENDGSLIVRIDGKERTVRAAEVSLRI